MTPEEMNRKIRDAAFHLRETYESFLGDSNYREIARAVLDECGDDCFFGHCSCGANNYIAIRNRIIK